LLREYATFTSMSLSDSCCSIENIYADRNLYLQEK